LTPDHNSRSPHSYNKNIFKEIHHFDVDDISEQNQSIDYQFNTSDQKAAFRTDKDWDINEEVQSIYQFENPSFKETEVRATSMLQHQALGNILAKKDNKENQNHTNIKKKSSVTAIMSKVSSFITHKILVLLQVAAINKIILLTPITLEAV